VKRSLFRKGLASLAVVGIAATGLLVTGSPPAHAAPDNVLTFVGSDTTEDVVEKVLVNPQPGGAADNGQEAHMRAMAYTFLWQQLSK